MGLIVKGTVIIDGQTIKNIDSVELTAEELSDSVVLMDGIDYMDKTPVPGFMLNVVKSSTITEPDWTSFNDKLAVIQEVGGKRHAYSEVRVKSIGSYRMTGEGGKETKTIEFMAKKRTTT